MLHCCIFLCGAALMIIELTGSRILAPFLGTSLVVWTSLIGIILASLSLGAWWGGSWQIVIRSPGSSAGSSFSLPGPLPPSACPKPGCSNFSKARAACTPLPSSPPWPCLHRRRFCLAWCPLLPCASAWKIETMADGQRAASMRFPPSAPSSAPFLPALSSSPGWAAPPFCSSPLPSWPLASWLADLRTKLLKGASMASFSPWPFSSAASKTTGWRSKAFSTGTPRITGCWSIPARRTAATAPPGKWSPGPRGGNRPCTSIMSTELVLPYTRFYRWLEYYRPGSAPHAGARRRRLLLSQICAGALS